MSSSRESADRYPLFPVEGKKVRRWITMEYGEKMVASGKYIKRCSDCTRNLDKANCMKIAGRPHNLEFQMKEGEAASLAAMDTSPSGITDWDMEIYATGSYKANADWQQIAADKDTADSVKVKVDSFAYQWRA